MSQLLMKRIVSLLLAMFLILPACSALAEEWACPNCGKVNQENFCTDCGTKRPESWVCPGCGRENNTAFCGFCGTAKPDQDADVTPGTWKFDYEGKAIYLVIRNDTEFVFMAPEGGRYEGTYTRDGNGYGFMMDEQTAYWGAYNPGTDTFTVYGVGEGQRTHETPGFSLKMDGQSMLDTIQDGELLGVECRDLSEYRRFDIVAVQYPNRGELLFVKRLAGLPGDTVEIREGYLYVNGIRYDESYINDIYRTYTIDFGPYTVPDDSYFVIGDHRNNSNDSRYIGALPARMMIGVVTSVGGKPVNNAAAVPAESIVQAVARYPLPAEYQEIIIRWADEYDLDPALVAAVVLTESDFRPMAESFVGARGLMQLMPDTAEWIAGKLGVENYSFDSMYDPETNIRFGCWYISYLKTLFDGDLVCTVAALLTGQGQVIFWLQDSAVSEDGRTIQAEKLPEGSTKRYVERVIEAYSNYAVIYDWGSM